MNPEEEAKTIQTMHNKCEHIKEILSKANGIARTLLQPQSDIGQPMNEPSGRLESLANELQIIQDSSESLLDYLIQIDELI